MAMQQVLYIFRDLKSSQDENLFMTCVSELVRETKEVCVVGSPGSR